MRRSAVIGVATLFVMVACTSGGDGVERASGTGEVHRGGTLRLALPDDFASTASLDPGSYFYTDWELARCCLLRTLYSYNGKPADEGGAQPRPDLAEGMPQVSSDGLTWTFRLKTGLHYAPPFADTPIVARDIVRALEHEARHDKVDYEYAYYFSVIQGFDDYPQAAGSIAGLEVQDDHTLVVRLSQPAGDLAYVFSLPATAPIPEGASAGHDADYGRFLVASGPYMVEGAGDLDFSMPPSQQQPSSGFVPATLTNAGVVKEPGSLTLVRNRSWDPATDPLRPAYPDRIEVMIGGGSVEELGRLVDSGQIDSVIIDPFGRPDFEQIARYQAEPALKGRVYQDATDVWIMVTMNVAEPPFDDLHVRRAVNMAIDEAALVDLVSRPPYAPSGGTATIGTHLAPDSYEGLLLRAFDPYPYDPEAAREEMRASKYDRTGDGVCDASVCRDVRAPVNDYAAIIPRQARVIRDELAKIGIHLALERTDSYNPLVFDPRSRVPIGIGSGWRKDLPEATSWLEPQFGSVGLEGGNGSLVGASPHQLRDWGYKVTSVPSVDDRIAACEPCRGVARTQCWSELDQYLMTQVVPMVPYMFMKLEQVVSDRVVDYSFDQFAGLPAFDRIALAPGSD